MLAGRRRDHDDSLAHPGAGRELRESRPATSWLRRRSARCRPQRALCQSRSSRSRARSRHMTAARSG